MALAGWMSGAGASRLDLRVREYAHVSDDKVSLTELYVGPLSRRLKPHEKLVLGPTPFHVVPPAHYATVTNPVVRHEATGAVVRGRDGQVECLFGRKELRYSAVLSEVLPPFPLYPDEAVDSIKPMEILGADTLFVIRVLSDYTTESGDGGRAGTVTRKLGDQYTLRGPCLYRPRLEEEVVRRQKVLVVPPDGTALLCRAHESFTRAVSGAEAVCVSGGSEYLFMTPGEFVPSPFEEVVRVVQPYTLASNGGVHIEVTRDYTDPRPFARGVRRRAGERFTVTCDDCLRFPLHVHDVVLRETKRITVAKNQFCVVTVPAEKEKKAEGNRQGGTPAPGPASPGVPGDGGEALGRYRQRRVLSDASFFLKPEEVLEVPPRPVYVLMEDQTVLLCALEDFVGSGNAMDTDPSRSTQRARHDRWLVRGPCQFVPSRHVRVVVDPRTGKEVREAVVLMADQGLYVRHTATGVIRLIAGPTRCILEACEEVWVKPLPPHVERCLGGAQRSNRDQETWPVSAKAAAAAAGQGRGRKRQKGGKGDAKDKAPTEMLPRDRAIRGVVYYVPHRGVTQLFNYRTQTTRTIFGPDRVLLEPDEDFTVVSLSGSAWDPARPNTCLPKEPNRITALYLDLGPSNMTDVMQVETSDHARLSLQLCYDWFFDIPYGDAAAASKCFTVNDFVGNTCSFIASRVRSAVASLPFDQFHRRCAQVLLEAVFGIDKATGKPSTELRFDENNLVITTVDIQEVQVLDARTQRGLRKPVETAIGITTHAQGAAAQQVALAREQEARGLLERKRMRDQVDNEEHRHTLLKMEQEMLSVESSSKLKAMAAAASEAAMVESTAALTAAQVRAEREVLVHTTLAEAQRNRKAALKQHEADLAREATDCQQALERIRHGLMERVIAALGPETITEFAKAGPELQASLLKSMGLQGYLVTDGSTPINLFHAAKGLTGDGNTVHSTVDA